MKATLHFNLEEPSDREAHLRATVSLDLVFALQAIRELRRKSEEVEPEKLADYWDQGIAEVFGDLPVELDSLSS